MQYLHLVAVALMSYLSLVAAEVVGYRGLARGITHEARAIVNGAPPFGHGHVEDRKVVARQDPATVTVTVTSIPEYCTTSASNAASKSTSALSTGAPSASQTAAVTGIPNSGVSGNLTSVQNGATETQGTNFGGVPVVPVSTAGESAVSSATSVGSSISSSLTSNLSSTITTSSAAAPSTTSELASSTTSALPTSNSAAIHGPGLFAVAVLLMAIIAI